MVSDPKIVQYVEEFDLLIIADGGKLLHITGDVIMGMWKAYAEGHGIDYDICEGCERVDPEATESPACESCQNQKTCKDAPIPPRYDCLGYKPEEGNMRLIDADALKKKKKHSYKEFFENVVSVYDIDNAPTIEAEPIKHGRWKKWEGDVLTCSNCKHYWIQSGDQYDFKYCPCCGARMDEVEE